MEIDCVINSCTIVAEMFCLRELERLNGVKTVYKIIGVIHEYGINFRNVDMEMYFVAELQHLRYYPVCDFTALCYKCIDFTTLAQKPPLFKPEGYRGIPRGPLPVTHR